MYTIYRNGQSFGPYTAEHLRHYMSQGLITADDLVFVDGAQRWVPLRQLLNQPAPSFTKVDEVRGDSPGDFAQALRRVTPAVVFTPLIIASPRRRFLSPSFKKGIIGQ